MKDICGVLLMVRRQVEKLPSSQDCAKSWLCLSLTQVLCTDLQLIWPCRMV